MSTIEVIDINECRYHDERGWALFPAQCTPLEFMAEADPRTIHFVCNLPNMVRGNHYHSLATEWLYFLNGTGLFYWQIEGDQTVSTMDIPGPGKVIKIPPGIRHALRNTGAEAMYFTAIKSRVPDGMEDQNVSAHMAI
ncbi:MAG: cupin domain-containing protein [Deltaproteobacteria bacterium]|nr:cupin domain-containing protein [Deltaproteobacteria bacterium]